MDWERIIGLAVGCGILLLIVGVFAAPVIYSIMSNAKDNDPAAHKKRVRDAIEKIKADGKVEGPKGPYVPHEKYAPGTDHETKGPKHAGRYHHPWH